VTTASARLVQLEGAIMIRRGFASILTICMSVMMLACGGGNPDEHIQRGTEYIAQKKYPEAIVEFRTALQLDPQRGRTRVQLADAYLANNDAVNGLREYVRAADQLPDNSDVQIKAGNLLLAARSYADARGRAQKVLDRDPKNVDALLLKANALAQLRELDAAQTEYQAAIAVDPGRFEAYLGLGALLSARGDADAAEAALVKAVALETDTVRARVALATFYASRGRRADTERVLADALKIDPNNLLVNQTLARFYMATGRASAAEPYFTAIAKSLPTRTNILALAQYYIRVNRPEDARRVLSEMAKRDDGYADANVALASLERGTGDSAAAAERIRQVLAKHPRHTGALLFDAQQLRTQRKYDEAMSQISRALEAEPNSAAGHIEAAAVYQATDRPEAAITSLQRALQTDPNAVGAMIQLAQLQLPRSPDKAATYAQQALALAPGNLDAAALLARSHAARGDLSAARRLVAAIREQQPKAPAMHNLEAVVALAAKNREAARRSFSRALEIDPGDLEALHGLSELDTADGRIDDAIRRIEAVPDDRRSEEFLIMSAGVYARAGRADQVEKRLREVTTRNPARLRAHALLGQLYTELNRLDDAVKQFEVVLERDPQSVSAHTLLGALHERRGDAAAAEKAYQSALEIDSQAAMAANNLAYLWVSSNRNLDQALNLAQSAQRSFPDDPRIADTLGWVYVKKGLPALAVPHLERAVRLMASDPAVHYHLGVAYQQSGHAEKAKQALQKALALKGDFKEAGEARKALSEVGA
jgi:tetratricopeptide (TPR) repeat protein